MSSWRPLACRFRALWEADRPSSAPAKLPASRIAAAAEAAGSPPSSSAIRPARYASAIAGSRLVDLGAAEDAPVARGERLGDRRGRPEDVDDDADRRRNLLGRCERDVYAHASTLASWPSRDIATGTRTGRRGSRARNADGRS